MIAKPSIAFNDFAGTAKDVTARSVNGRNVLSVRAYQDKVDTPSQAVQRNSLSKVSRAYKQLSDSQMSAWGTLAERIKGISTFGITADITAHNAFVKINRNRLLVGKSLLSDAPTYTDDVPEVDYDDFWVTPSKILFTGLNIPGDNYYLVVKMSQSLSVGVTNGWRKTVIVAPGADEDWGDADLTDYYFDVIGFNPSIGDKVFIELYWLDGDTGFVGETMRITAIVKNESQIENVASSARKLYTMRDIDTDSSHVSSFNLETTTGGCAVAVDAMCLGHSNVASSEVVVNEALTALSGCQMYALGRSADGTKINAQSYIVYVSISGSTTKLTFAHRGGYYAKPTEVFGAAIVFK